MFEIIGPYILKALRSSRVFANAVFNDRMSFSKDPKEYCIKNDPSKLLAKEHEESETEGDMQIGLRNTQLIRQVGPSAVSDAEFAELDLKEQREAFLSMMIKLGYPCRSEVKADHTEDKFIVVLHSQNLLDFQNNSV